MSNKLTDIGINNHTYYFFDESFDLNNIKIDEKSYKDIHIYYIGYVTINYLKYIKTNSVNLLHVIFDKVNGYFEKINGSKYLMLVPTNDNKEKIEKYE